MIDVLIIVAVLGYSGWIGVRFWRKSRQGACAGCASTGACPGCPPAADKSKSAEHNRSESTK
ncbi:Virus attachment protein p12 family protein [compost metagenome]